MECCCGSNIRGIARSIGHGLRLTPPAYIKPYVRHGKTDAADPRRSARQSDDRAYGLAPVKSLDNRPCFCTIAYAMVRQRTMPINALHRLFVESGIVAPPGRTAVWSI